MTNRYGLVGYPPVTPGHLPCSSETHCMYSYYVFESSFPGSGDGGDRRVLTDPTTMREVIADFLRTRWSPNSAGTLVIRVYQRGDEVAVRDIYPFIGIKLPGLTEITWDRERRVHGGEPEPAAYSRLATQSPDGRCRVLPAEEVLPPVERRSLGVRVDWAGLDLLTLIPPVLPERAGVGLVERRPALDGNDSR
ncbi:hypothetical protein GCM10023196_067080 [Actinoallomurus vinaceus]|uniref:Uncharacterized protein n=1 Tax=Actinoallomurus vinaceus TaxID=1080074 RepID=A0ABP8UL70_9ACTN